MRLERSDDRLCVRQDESLIIVRAQAADPCIEELHRIRASIDLTVEILRQSSADFFHQRMPGAWV